MVPKLKKLSYENFLKDWIWHCGLLKMEETEPTYWKFSRCIKVYYYIIILIKQMTKGQSH